MLPQKLKHFLHRFIEMGPLMAGTLIYHRARKKIFIARWHTMQKKNLTAQRKQKPNPDFCGKILNDPEFEKTLPAAYKDSSTIYHRADCAAQPSARILGFGRFVFDDNNIPWHSDFTLPEASPDSWQHAFYANISIPVSAGLARGADIKVPWELSRFHQLFDLGMGYQHAMRQHKFERAQKYARACTHQVSDWIEKNPFLIGVNWLNPMEVGIRAINLIWAFYFFNHSPYILDSFWEKLASTLHDHQVYITHNWELSDRPNNHYIADLLGSLYISVLFGDKQQHVTIKKLSAQFAHQVLPDGSSYEGSTSYHKLVTEMMQHFMLLTKHTKPKLDLEAEKRYNQMLQFLADCSDHAGNLVQIGDNDSGKIVAGFQLPPQQIAEEKQITYPDFGLTILRTSEAHITFRHQTYQPHQPSGHFHQDALSLTLSIKGIPLIIDPGSYRYTADPAMRNYFRSAQQHNAFFMHDNKVTDTDLFQLSRTPSITDACTTQHKNKSILLDTALHNNNTPRAQRALSISENQIFIQDQWLIQDPDLATSKLTIWTLHMAPNITIHQQSCNSFIIKHNNQPYAHVITTLQYQMIQNIMSPAYGLQSPNTTAMAWAPMGRQAQSILITY